MVRITIDSGVVAVPQNVGARDELYGYVDALRDWRELLSEPWAVVMMSERAGEVLAECGMYPFFERLRELFRGYEIEEYDANTVYKMACGLLTHTRSFEEYYRVKDVLADSVETCPDVLAEIEQGRLRTEMERCVLLLAILKKHGVPAGEHQCMVWGGMPGGTVGVRGEVHCVEHERADLGDVALAPEVFEGEILLCRDFRDVLRGIDEADVLAEAADDEDVELAIRVAILKHQVVKEEDADWSVDVPAIGREFRLTCLQCCTDQGRALAGRILQSVVESVGNEKLRQVHKLRTGAGANNPQQKRGRDRAQRRDIDHEFHLHYWECEGGRIELASVVHHNDFSIPR